MRRALKYLMIIGFLSAMALSFVGLKIGQYQLSYSIYKNRLLLDQKQDNRDQLHLEVTQMKSFDALEDWIKNHDVPLILPSQIQSIENLLISKIKDAGLVLNTVSLSGLQLIPEAHADPINSAAE